jgi:hypothetical protein
VSKTEIALEHKVHPGLARALIARDLVSVGDVVLGALSGAGEEVRSQRAVESGIDLEQAPGGGQAELARWFEAQTEAPDRKAQLVCSSAPSRTGFALSPEYRRHGRSDVRRPLHCARPTEKASWWPRWIGSATGAGNEATRGNVALWFGPRALGPVSPISC